jgi:hypothetical protein
MYIKIVISPISKLNGHKHWGLTAPFKVTDITTSLERQARFPTPTLLQRFYHAISTGILCGKASNVQWTKHLPNHNFC